MNSSPLKIGSTVVRAILLIAQLNFLKNFLILFSIVENKNLGCAVCTKIPQWIIRREILPTFFVLSHIFYH